MGVAARGQPATATPDDATGVVTGTTALRDYCPLSSPSWTMNCARHWHCCRRSSVKVFHTQAGIRAKDPALAQGWPEVTAGDVSGDCGAWHPLPWLVSLFSGIRPVFGRLLILSKSPQLAT